uniref:Uncharacterized protein n=1 Tax=Amphiprion percula TaxID=161767 RepID=A0A3P8RIZ8_AMPPE
MKTSLDRCIQTALASLYPPFQVTSPTVLCQVLSVVEHCYRGDGLRYLIHFLLPAKNFLQNLQQDACVQYCGLLFRHEGWPLCVHEKIVVQLCPLDQHLLRPGDFYLLVSPAPRLLLCSWAGRHVEQQEVSQLALRSLFSMAWLDSVNRDRERRGAPRLERLLLAAHGDVFRVPWEDLVYPQFISRPRPPREDQDGLMNSSRLSSGQDGKLLPLTKTDQSAASSDGEDSEGEYVELMDLPRFSPQKGSLTQSISLQHRARTTTHTPTHTTTTHTPGTTTHTPGTTTHTPGTTTHTPGTTTHTPTHATTTHSPGTTTHIPTHRERQLRVVCLLCITVVYLLCTSFVCLLCILSSVLSPGSMDRAGRALLTVSTCSSMWSDPDCDSAELLRLLLYYTSTLRKQTRASGLTVLMDARRAAPAAAMFSALRLLQVSVHLDRWKTGRHTNIVILLYILI